MCKIFVFFTRLPILSSPNFLINASEEKYPQSIILLPLCFYVGIKCSDYIVLHVKAKQFKLGVI